MKKAFIPNRKGSGFTLLELVIVIIIIGVLTSLALPRMFAMVEGARQIEAVAIISTIRAALERSYLLGNSPLILGPDDDWGILSMGNPANDANAHFVYVAGLGTLDDGPADSMFIAGLRNCRDGGDPGAEGSNPANMIWYGQNFPINRQDLCGFGYYKNLKHGGSPCDSWLEWWGEYGSASELSEFLVSWPLCI